MSRRARILLIGYRKFSELINAVLPEYESEAEVIIVESVASGSVDYPALVREHRPDVVASAGSNATYLEKTLKLPVIAQPVTDTDVIDAVSRARRIAPRVHVFTYAQQQELSDRVFEALERLDGRPLQHQRYSTPNEASEQLLALAAAGETDVVVGPSYVCHLAEQRGLASVLIYSKVSARRMLDEALTLARSRRRWSASPPSREPTPAAAPRCCSRARAVRARSISPGRSTASPITTAVPSWRSTAAAFPTNCSRRSFSATSTAPSPAPAAADA